MGGATKYYIFFIIYIYVPVGTKLVVGSMYVQYNIQCKIFINNDFYSCARQKKIWAC
jgi:hypothetical protein